MRFGLCFVLHTYDVSYLAKAIGGCTYPAEWATRYEKAAHKIVGGSTKRPSLAGRPPPLLTRCRAGCRCALPKLISGTDKTTAAVVSGGFIAPSKIFFGLISHTRHSYVIPGVFFHSKMKDMCFLESQLCMFCLEVHC